MQHGAHKQMHRNVQVVTMLTALAVYHAQVSDICMHLAAMCCQACMHCHTASQVKVPFIVV